MDANGQVITLPGVIVTHYLDDTKHFVPFDNIDGISEMENYTIICFKREVDGTKNVNVKEKISTILSAEEAAKFAVDFGGAFMRGMTEKINTMRKLQGVK